MEAAFEASGVRDTMWVLGNRFDSFTKLWPHNRRRKCNPKNVIPAASVVRLRCLTLGCIAFSCPKRGSTMSAQMSHRTLPCVSCVTSSWTPGNRRMMWCRLVNSRPLSFGAMMAVRFSAEHRKHAPACALLNLDMEESRIKTFRFWPADQFKAPVAEVWQPCPCNQTR